MTDFSSTNGALCAVKRTEECDETQVDLTRHYVKSSVIMSAVLCRVYFTWKHPMKHPSPLDRSEISMI